MAGLDEQRDVAYATRDCSWAVVELGRGRILGSMSNGMSHMRHGIAHGRWWSWEGVGFWAR
jgi:hypothetical protein